LANEGFLKENNLTLVRTAKKSQDPWRIHKYANTSCISGKQTIIFLDNGSK
jgi:hypothetical protein